jgi:hypothetical protein
LPLKRFGFRRTFRPETENPSSASAFVKKAFRSATS